MTIQVDPLIAMILMNSTNLDAYIQASHGDNPKMQKAMRRLHNLIKALDNAYAHSSEEWTYSTK